MRILPLTILAALAGCAYECPRPPLIFDPVRIDLKDEPNCYITCPRGPGLPTCAKVCAIYPPGLDSELVNPK